MAGKKSARALQVICLCYELLTLRHSSSDSESESVSESDSYSDSDSVSDAKDKNEAASCELRDSANRK